MRIKFDNTLLLFIILFVSILNLHSQVSQEWVKRFSFTTDAGDTAYSLVVDGSGYIYVAGIVWRNEDDVAFNYLYDYCTIKYEPDGQYAWTAPE